MLRTRALSAVAIVIPVAVLLWLGDLAWLAGIVAVAALGVHEFAAAMRQNGRRPLAAMGWGLAVALPCAAYADPTLTLMLPVLVLAVAGSLVFTLARPHLEGALDDWALSLSGMLYVTLLLAYFVALRQVDRGLQWILLALLCTWACDSAAYLVGRAIGKHLFAPRISPKKTWEGVVGGIAAAMAAGLLAVPLVGAHPVAALLLGGGVAAVAVVGDLAESFIKRQFGIKDFGTLIPGHGGVLDRVDSLLFAVPFVYYVYLTLAFVGGS